jgi:hypothetical protein
LKIPNTKQQSVGVAQGVVPESKTQYHTHTHKKKEGKENGRRINRLTKNDLEN